MRGRGAALLTRGQAVPPGGFIAGLYYMTQLATSTGTSATRLSGSLYYTPLLVGRPGAGIDRMAARWTVAGSAGAVVRLGLYADDGTFRPGALLLDAGTVDATQAPGFYEIVVNQSTPVGVYWLAATNQGAPATLPTVVTPVGVGQSFGLSTPAQFPGAGLFDSVNTPGALPAQATPIASGITPIAAWVRAA